MRFFCLEIFQCLYASGAGRRDLWVVLPSTTLVVGLSPSQTDWLAPAMGCPIAPSDLSRDVAHPRCSQLGGLLLGPPKLCLKLAANF